MASNTAVQLVIDRATRLGLDVHSKTILGLLLVKTFLEMVKIPILYQPEQVMNFPAHRELRIQMNTKIEKDFGDLKNVNESKEQWVPTEISERALISLHHTNSFIISTYFEYFNTTCVNIILCVPEGAFPFLYREQNK